MCLDTLQAQPCVRPTVLASRDLPQEMICDDLADIPCQPHYPRGDLLTDIEYGTYQEAGQDNMVDSITATLVHRPKVAQRVTFAEANIGLQSGSDSNCSDSTSIFKLPGIATSFPAPPSFNCPTTQPTNNDDSSSEDQGFMLVSRPKPHILATIDEPMSSPEIVPTPVVDILAVSGTDYSSDDEWDMI